MPVVLAALWYLIRLIRRPIDVRLKCRQLGGSSLVVGAVAIIGLWTALRPTGIPNAYFYGDIAGVLAVYLMSWSLVLATRLPGLERWFGGLDRMYVWHNDPASSDWCWFFRTNCW